MHAAVRLGPLRVFGDCPGVQLPAAAWRVGGHSPERDGWLRGHDLDGTVPAPAGFALDVGDWRDVSLVRVDDDGFILEVVAAVSFEETHPREWIEQLSSAGVAIVAAGDRTTFDSAAEWLDETRFAVVPVLTWVSTAGIGATHTPPPGDGEGNAISRADLRLALVWLDDANSGALQTPPRVEWWSQTWAELGHVGRMNLLGALMVLWHRFCLSAVEAGAFDRDQDAVDVTVDRACDSALAAGVPPEIVGGCTALAAYWVADDMEAVQMMCSDRAMGYPIEPFSLTAGFFLDAQTIALKATAQAQGRPLRELVAQWQQNVS